MSFDRRKSKMRRASSLRPCVMMEDLEGRRLLSVSLPLDVNTTPLSTVTPTNLTDVNGTLYFVHSDGIHGAELWKTDGTTAGTSMVVDLRPGADGSNPTSLTNINGTLYFSAADAQYNGDQIWRTDGTAAGTVRVADILPGSNAPAPYGFTQIGGTVYFFANRDNTTAGYGLWTLNPATDAVARVTDIDRPTTLGVSPIHPVAMGGALYFATSVSSAGQLWRSDGTEAGTNPIAQFEGSSPFDSPIVAVGNRLYFTYANKQLWTSDGTGAGTVKIAEIGTGADSTTSIANLTAVGSTLFFSANNGTTGNELWAAEGTTTRLVRDINNAGTSSSSPGSMVNFGGKLYFAATGTNTGRELYTSDGTSAGTTLVKDIRTGTTSSGPLNLTVANNKLYFYASAGVVGQIGAWVSDGTTAGTVLLQGFAGVTTFKASLFTASGANVYFAADDAASGTEVWRTRGTPGDAQLVKDVYAMTDSAQPVLLGSVNGRLIFAALDATHGAEPWVTDGTAAGTMLLADINVGTGSSTGSSAIAAGGYLYFNATDGTSNALWRTDGTPAGTIKLRGFTSKIIYWQVLNDRPYFTTGETTGSLWTSDGTAAGTKSVPNSTGFRSLLTVFNGVIYGMGSDATSGAEVWASDGTAAGTHRVTDINPGSASSNPAGMCGMGDALYLFAEDGVSNGNKLYKYTPGTGAASLVVDIATGVRDYFSGIVLTVGGKLYFPTSTGSEIGVSDGTAAGTHIIDIRPGDIGSNPQQLVELNGIVLFAANDGSADHLYRTDGTDAGTYPLLDIAPEYASTAVSFVRAGNTVYMAAYANGFQGIWQTDGTAAGTLLASSLDPGGSGYAGQVAAAGGSIYFTADDYVHGIEVWRLVPESVPLTVRSSKWVNGVGLQFDLGRALGTGLTPADLIVEDLATGTAIPEASITRSYDAAAGKIVFSFPGYPGNVLPAGNYRATLPAGGAADIDGDPLAATYVTTFTVSPPATNAVAARQIFYNNTYFDGYTSAASAQDASAIATDKEALLPGQTAAFKNYINSPDGITGIFVDFTGAPAGPLDPADFKINVGNSGAPGGWSSGPTPTVTVLPGSNPTTRVALTWSAGSIVNEWVQVTVLANARTGLSSADVFYFGDAAADTGNDLTSTAVNAADYYGVRDHLRGYADRPPVTWTWDFNRDGVTDATDLMLARSRATTAGGMISLISAPATVSAASTKTAVRTATLQRLSIANAPRGWAAPRKGIAAPALARSGMRGTRLVAAK